MANRRTVAGRLIALLLGTITMLLLAELALRLLGAGFAIKQDLANRPAEGEDAITVLCLGESSTALGGDYAYPHQLESLLEQYGQGRKFHVINGGLPGIDSLVIVQNLDQNLRRYEPDIVTVMMGINDGLKGFIDINRYEGKSQARQLLQRVRLFRMVRYFRFSLAAEMDRRATEEEFAKQELGMQQRLQQTQDPEDALRLGQLYRRQGKYPEAEALLLEWLAREESARLYVDLGRIYHDMFMPEKEEELYRIALDKYPTFDRTYRWMRRLLGHEDRDPEIELLLLRQVGAVPNARSYLELAKYYQGAKRFDEAEAAFRASMAAEPTPQTPCDMATMLIGQQRYEEAEELLRYSLSIDPRRHTYVELAKVQLATDRHEQAVASLRQAIDTEEEFVQSEFSWDARPYDEHEPYVLLAKHYRQQGDEEKAKAVLAEIAPNELTLYTHTVVVEKVMNDVGRLVITQYPTRPIEPLQAIVPEQPGLIFVENKDRFDEALRREGFNALFVDHYAGDFGHTSRRGHELVALELAEAILREYFELPGPLSQP